MGVALGPRGFVLDISDLLVLEGGGRRLASMLFVYEGEMREMVIEGNDVGGVGGTD